MAQKELKDIAHDQKSGVTVEVTGNSLAHLTGYVEGEVSSIVCNSWLCRNCSVKAVCRPQRYSI